MTVLKLIVPKEYPENPEYTRHVKKFDMLSMPRMANTVPIDALEGNFTFEMGRPLNKIDGDHSFFSKGDKEKAASNKKKIKGKFKKLKDNLSLDEVSESQDFLNESQDFLNQAAASADAKSVAASKKQEEEEQQNEEQTISELVGKFKGKILSSGLERSFSRIKSGDSNMWTGDLSKITNLFNETYLESKFKDLFKDSKEQGGGAEGQSAEKNMEEANS